MALTHKDVLEFAKKHFGEERTRDIFRLDLATDRYTVWEYRRDDEGKLLVDKNHLGQARPVVRHTEVKYAS